MTLQTKSKIPEPPWTHLVQGILTVKRRVKTARHPRVLNIVFNAYQLTMPLVIYINVYRKVPRQRQIHVESRIRESFI